MYKTHRRSQFKVGSKTRLMHDMKIVLIAFRKKTNIVKFNDLQ